MDSKTRSKVKQKIKILRDIELKLPQEKYFSITRMRNVNVLCNVSSQALMSFAFCIADKTANKIDEEQVDDKINNAVDRALKLMNLSLIEIHENLKITKETQEELNNIRKNLYDFQCDTRIANFGTVIRSIKNWNILTIEDAINCFCDSNNNELGYTLAKDYVEKYNSRYGTGLIIDSIPDLKDIITFWEEYYQEIL